MKNAIQIAVTAACVLLAALLVVGIARVRTRDRCVAKVVEIQKELYQLEEDLVRLLQDRD